MRNKPGNEEISGLISHALFLFRMEEKNFCPDFFYFYREETEGPLPLKTKKSLTSHKIFFFCTTES